MRCAWCTLPFEQEEFRLEDRGDLFHAVCWLKKLHSIGVRNDSFVRRREGDLYPGPLDMNDPSDSDGE